MRIRAALIAIIALVSAAFIAVPAVRATAVTPAVPSGYHLAAHPLSMSAIKESIAKHKGVLTLAEAKRLGVTPGTIYVNTPQVRSLATAVRKSELQVSANRISAGGRAARPDSASGCNEEVCIEVTGSGLVVTKWFTAAFSPDYDEICSFPAFWVDDEIDFVGDEICGTEIEAWDDATEDFENNTQLCNSWPGVAGFPCETVHD